jgi:hypothetical protein
MDSRVNSHSEKFVVARGGKSGGPFSVKTKATREKPKQRPRVHASFCSYHSLQHLDPYLRNKLISYNYNDIRNK